MNQSDSRMLSNDVDDNDITEEGEVDEDKLKKLSVKALILQMKQRGLAGYSGKKKEDLITKIVNYDMEKNRILREKELMKDDFGNCEECEEADRFFIMKAKYICHDCQINMCEQCEMAHKRVGGTKYHFTEALVKLNIPVSSLRKNVSEFEVEDLNNSVANMSVDNIENPCKPWWANFNTSE